MIHRKPALAAVLGVLALVALFGSTVEADYATRPYYAPNVPNSNVPNPCELGGGASIGAAPTPCSQ
ncbi:MAG: hypothetical protein ABI854_02785 [Betaproteobacteria bacterium]